MEIVQYYKHKLNAAENIHKNTNITRDNTAKKSRNFQKTTPSFVILHNSQKH